MKLRMVMIMLLAAASTACGGISLDDYFDAELDADCERRARCGEWTSKEECILWMGSAPNFRELELRASVAAGRVTYSPGRAEACVEHLRTASCDWTSEDRRTTNHDCEATFRGHLAAGDTCYSEEDCRGDCAAPPNCSDTSCPATCYEVEPLSDIGGPCGFDDCVDGAVCDGGICVALAPAGAPCSQPLGCDYGFVCIDGTCQDTANRGESCENNWCENDTGDRCDETSSTCVARRGVGGLCRWNIDCMYPLMCGPSLVCVAPPVLGEPCLDGSCGLGLYCDAGTCADR